MTTLTGAAAPSREHTPATSGQPVARGARLRRWGALAVVAAATLLSACQTTGSSPTTKMLSAAGFNMRIADTPDKKAALASLPARNITMRTVKGKLLFLYADPAGCNCLYVGNQTNYQTFQGLSFDRSVASQQLLAAQMNAESEWDYGVWGPAWW